MNRLVIVAMTVGVVSAAALPAHADWGFLKGFERIFDKPVLRDTVLRQAARLTGTSRQAWVALSRGFAQMATKAISTVRRLGGVPGVDVAGYFKNTSNAFLVGAVMRHLPFGGGLTRWLERKSEDYARRVLGLVRALGSPETVVTSIQAYARRVFSTVRGIVAGTVKYTAGTMTALLADFDQVFTPVIQNLIRLARATPRRAKAAIDKFFGRFAQSLLAS